MRKFENVLKNSNLELELGKESLVKLRLKKRKNYNASILKKLKENQVMLSKKRKLANYVIDNNFAPSIMKHKVNLLKNKILYERNSS